MTQALSDANIAMVAMAENLVDKIWEDRPPRPLDIVMTHPLQYSGMLVSCGKLHDPCD